ncbi:hypothetical protein UVI_02050290 [Ustilaginoidea virens]|uniref:Uncharacterized protein n=1 Tax=Ustilaginoidea virens TaxID=1159556 RepID=A0A1B5KXB3_USTVR|nr:hypothetical protein UVI_02050290 [Ustilaginoidea virens]
MADCVSDILKGAKATDGAYQLMQDVQVEQAHEAEGVLEPEFSRGYTRGVYEAHGVLEKATAKNKGLLVRGIVLALMNDARARHQNVQNYPQAFRGAPAEARENASAVGRCRKNSANYGSYSNYSGDTFSLFRSDV